MIRVVKSEWLEKEGISIEVDGEKYTLEDFQGLNSDEKFDAIAFLMRGVQKQIMELANRISEYQNRQRQLESDIKGVGKAIMSKLNKRSMVHDILYDRVGYSDFKDYMKGRKYQKSKNPLERLWLV